MFVSKIYCKLALYVNRYSVFRMTIGVMARGGGGVGRGGLQPPQILGNSVFWAARENLGKARF